MRNSRWKVMACSLGLSVGGLAIVAGPMNSKLNAQYEVRKTERTSPESTAPAPIDAPEYPADNKPFTALAPETLPPVQNLEFVLPVPAQTQTITPVAQLEVAPATAEKLPSPRPADQPFEISTETVVTTPVPVAPTVPPAPVAPAPQADIPPVVETRMLPPAEAPMVMQQLPTVPPMTFNPPPAPAQPLPPATAQTSAVAQTGARLKMLMRLGDGKPRFEIRNSDSTDLLLKVYGEKVEMQQAADGMRSSPIAGVTATGQVRFVGPGVEGTCDQLSVLSGTGEVLLKGNVTLKSSKGKSWTEVKAEKMIYQINASGLTSVTGSGSIRPASYTPAQR